MAGIEQNGTFDSQPHTEAERVDQASRLLTAYKHESEKTPEVATALSEAYFNPRTEKGKAFKLGIIKVRKGQFDWDVQYEDTAGFRGIALWKWIPPNLVRHGEVMQEHVIIKIREGQGVQKQADEDSPANIIYQCVFSYPRENSDIYEDSTPGAIRHAERFLEDFKSA
jgi:hypothetical protein